MQSVNAYTGSAYKQNQNNPNFSGINSKVLKKALSTNITGESLANKTLLGGIGSNAVNLGINTFLFEHATITCLGFATNTAPLLLSMIPVMVVVKKIMEKTERTPLLIKKTYQNVAESFIKNARRHNLTVPSEEFTVKELKRFKRYADKVQKLILKPNANPQTKVGQKIKEMFLEKEAIGETPEIFKGLKPANTEEYYNIERRMLDEAAKEGKKVSSNALYGRAYDSGIVIPGSIKQDEHSLKEEAVKLFGEKKAAGVLSKVKPLGEELTEAETLKGIEKAAMSEFKNMEANEDEIIMQNIKKEEETKNSFKNFFNIF